LTAPFLAVPFFSLLLPLTLSSVLLLLVSFSSYHFFVDADMANSEWQTNIQGTRRALLEMIKKRVNIHGLIDNVKP
jgi:uncharacterized membrane protein YqhA